MWLPEAEGAGTGNLMKVQTGWKYKRYKFPVLRQVSTREVMYDKINKINTTVCYVWKILRE